MNARPLTDAQITAALRAHLPEAAASGLRERVLDAAETTAQLRALPSFLGALGEADPVSRRRNMLIAAALVAALAFASAAAVGALRRSERDPIDELSLEPPADVPAFVLSSYERLPHLPPVALTWHDSDSNKGRIYVHRSGAVRFDRFTSADTTEPSSYTVLSGNTQSGVATVGSDKVWVEPDEAIGDDPRVFLRTVLAAEDTSPGCEMERSSSEVANGSAAAGWRYVGLEYVAGRPTHHVTCGGGDLWIDIETRLILRTQGPAVDDTGRPIPVESTEVTEIAFGEQPAALFQAPEGLARMSAEEYNGYICARDLPNELAPGISDCPTAETEATPSPEPTPTPTPTVRPGSNECTVPPGDPSEPIGPLAWTPERLKQDWPAPVRPEPAGEPRIQPIPLTYGDLIGDNGSTGFHCADIRGVMADTRELHLKLVSSQHVVDPADAWIAYGVVIDDDRDGVPDVRYGIDNIPLDAVDVGPPTRGWRTDLHTGHTDAGPEHDERVRAAYVYGTPPNRSPQTKYPREGSDAGFLFSGASETTTGSSGWGIKLDTPFYAWASVIVNGRVVATDYAPDTGWLVATRDVWPGGTLLVGDPLPNLSMTVPEGWTRSSTKLGPTPIGDATVLKRVTCGDLARHVMPDGALDAFHCATVGFDVIDDPQDICDDTIAPPPGSSFDDLVTYVAGLPTIVTPEDADVTVDGYRGKHFQYSWVEGSLDCLWDSDDIWILDVDGVHLMIRSRIGGDLDLDVPKAAVKAEIRQMVESIRFER